MITKYTFSLKNNKNTFHAPKYKSTDYSKILDDLIAADIKDKNPWLYGNSGNYTTSSAFLNTGDTIKININGNKTNDDIIDAIIKNSKKSTFENACIFLNNYGKINNSCPFIKDKIYYLANGTPFYLTDDYITIGFDTYYFYEFGKPLFINTLSENTKKTIATIFIDGLKITIKK